MLLSFTGARYLLILLPGWQTNAESIGLTVGKRAAYMCVRDKLRNTVKTTEARRCFIVCLSLVYAERWMMLQPSTVLGRLSAMIVCVGLAIPEGSWRCK